MPGPGQRAPPFPPGDCSAQGALFVSISRILRGSHSCSHRAVSREVAWFTGIDVTWHPMPPSVLAGTRHAAVCYIQQTGRELRVTLTPSGPALQVRVPGVGELCLLAAQWVCTRPPFGYRMNTGSKKGCWHSWQRFWSESWMALPFSFILSYV